MTAKFYGLDSSLVHDAAPVDGFCIDMVRASEYVKLESEVAALQEQVRALADSLESMAGAMLNRTLDSGSKQAVAYADCADMVAKFAAKLREGEQP